MSDKWKLYVCLMLNKHNMHRTFAFWSMRLSREYASILHNRRACSVLQGIGGWAANKQSAKSKTFTLLPIRVLSSKFRRKFQSLLKEKLPDTDKTVLEACYGSRGRDRRTTLFG